ncbi:mucin-2-like [Lepisosteus oculatus]|uniref:mucin-2-like n=1 Tax=Lepisosteus oculatus TaxID=7918 RepID=UPI0035F500B4
MTVWAVVWMASVALAAAVEEPPKINPILIRNNIPLVPTIQVLPGVVAHPRGVCSTWGRHHYRMFDGELYQLPGPCNYVLASHCRAAYEHFNIQIRRNVTPSDSAISQVTMKLEGMVLELRRETVSVNGELVNLPFIQGGVLAERSGESLRVTARLGLELQWDWKDALSVAIDEQYRNQTCGLCGDFNGIKDSDRVTAAGVPISPLEFGKLQKLDGPTEHCEDPTAPPPETNCTEAVSTPPSTSVRPH